jgi:endonuclease YncB( thermonuclease family)
MSLAIRPMLEFIDPLLDSTWALRAGGLLLCAGAGYLYLRRARPMKIVTVIDGDTVMAVDLAGKNRKLRIKGIDCPELGQRMSLEAKEYAEELLKGQWVSVRFYGRDKFKRHIARIEVRGLDISKEMVRSGRAFPMKGSGLGMLALGARMTGKGVWKSFGQVKPWESSSRDSPIMRTLNSSKKWRQFRKGQLEKQHRRRK